MQQLVPALLVGLFVIHFVFTGIYVLPPKYFPKWIHQVVTGYMTPVFHQAWHLFAPDPPLKEKSLQYKVKGQEGWSGWIDPTSELLLAHDRWRLGNANIRYRMHQNAAYRLWAEHEIAMESAVNRSDFDSARYLHKSRGMTTVRHYALQHFLQQSGASVPDSLIFRLHINTPPPFPQTDGDWTFEIIDLPAVSAHDE